MADPQDSAEALDDDKLDDDERHDMIESSAAYPPDRPQGVGTRALTAALEAMGESVEDRADRTTPDPLAEAIEEEVGLEDALAAERRAQARTDTGGAGLDEGELDTLLAAFDDRNALDDPNEVDLVPGADPAPVGRLVDAGSGDLPADAFFDDEADLVADLDSDPERLDDPDLSAEEAAMHLTVEPDYDTRDSYLDDRD